jgi:ABC-2 type transport system permease protein
MPESVPSGLQTGIYDLGYRTYDGPRLGRGYAAAALFAYSFRAVFGLGRGAWTKVFAFGLSVIALTPALVQLAIAAVAPAEFEFASPENYFEFISVVLALFCAVAAPEVVGRDQRYHILALYFSRSLSRFDYVSAKLAALIAALFVVQTAPQLLLLSGNAVATDDVVQRLIDDLALVPPIVAGALLVAAMMGGVSLAIASQTSRRAFSTGAVIAYFVIATPIGSILFETADGEGYLLLISPFAVLIGAIHWLFGSTPPLGSEIRQAGLDGFVYAATALAYAAVAIGLVYRRFLRMTV